MEEIVEVVKMAPQERISESTCEQNGFIEVLKISSEDRILQRTEEQILDESVVTRERGQQRIDKQIVELLMPLILEEIVEVVRRW